MRYSIELRGDSGEATCGLKNQKDAAMAVTTGLKFYAQLVGTNGRVVSLKELGEDEPEVSASQETALNINVKRP